jgi:hypothetical protein
MGISRRAIKPLLERAGRRIEPLNRFVPETAEVVVYRQRYIPSVTSDANVLDPGIIGQRVILMADARHNTTRSSKNPVSQGYERPRHSGILRERALLLFD